MKGKLLQLMLLGALLGYTSGAALALHTSLAHHDHDHGHTHDEVVEVDCDVCDLLIRPVLDTPTEPEARLILRLAVEVSVSESHAIPRGWDFGPARPRGPPACARV